MTPAEDALLLLQIVARHLAAMRVNLDPAFTHELRPLTEDLQELQT